MKLKIFAVLFQNLKLDNYQGIKAGNPHFYPVQCRQTQNRYSLLRMIRGRYVRHALPSCLNRAVWSIEAWKMAADSMYTQGLDIVRSMQY